MAKGLKKGRRRLRGWHKWPSIVLLVFVIVFAASGVVMNHRSLFSGVDIPRRHLLPEYRYASWNNAAVRGGCALGGDSLLVYGNIGVWLTDTTFASFRDMNDGFPGGIDNRKIFKVIRTQDGDVLAGTLFGLWRYSGASSRWAPLSVPGAEGEVVDIIEGKDGQVLVMTRSRLFRMDGTGSDPVFTQAELPAPAGYLDRASLFKTLWVIHSGEIAGLTGKLAVDLMGLIFIFLGISGIVYWLFPKWMKRRKADDKGIRKIARVNNFSVKWHNRIGIWAVAFMTVTTITGMFLRPPLLIAIANAQVGKIPFTVLDSPNPWHDQLRRIMYDPQREAYLVGTNRGIYHAEPGFDRPLLPFPGQPPLSVMGINVFERTGAGDYLVGSFNGLFLWNPYQGWMIDYFSPGSAVVNDPSGPPLSDNMIAGAMEVGIGNLYVFDYNRGLVAGRGSRPFPPMPEEVVDKSPMSLWNLALEFHTGRYYSFLFGNLYILFIPLFGIAMLVILVTGSLLWWRRFKRKRA